MCRFGLNEDADGERLWTAAVLGFANRVAHPLTRTQRRATAANVLIPQTTMRVPHWIRKRGNRQYL
jgi:hypothetical protein